MAPGYGSGYSQEVRVTLDGLGELPAEMWGDYGVPWSDVADAKSGTRTTIYRDDGSKLVIEPRGIVKRLQVKSSAVLDVRGESRL